MTDNLQRLNNAPAMGERRARWGLGYQDKVATARILDILREELRTGLENFRGVRLADLEAGQVDDFVIVWNTEVQGSSIKWSRDAAPINWGELIGTDGLLKQLAEGAARLLQAHPGKTVSVRLQSNRPASTEKHPAQLIKAFSVTEFLRDYWSDGPRAGDSPDVEDSWAKIGQHVGRQGNELSEFVKRCEVILGFPEPPIAGPDTDDFRQYRKQFDELHKAIATWITNNPNLDFIDRQLLLHAIGFHAHRSGLVQRFPPPRIPYETNGTSSEQLTELIESTPGGYLALTGPAGVGKSTLVQDVLSACPFFVPYYAYLPDGEGNPRDRGEALTFFQDAVTRLDRFFPHRYSIGIADVAHGRSALREHMKNANDRFLLDGKKTILLIDGLDHVAREIGLERPILQEFPRPEEIPDGFLIILSSQPQALEPGVIERHVAEAVKQGSDRRLDVEGLTREEVHGIVSKSKKPTDADNRNALAEACQGNPLILTYLLNGFDAKKDTTVAEAITAAGNYTGDIDQYYRSALSVPLTDLENKYLLALLCRAVPIIPTRWLQDWPERTRLERLYTQIIAPFIREDNGQLYFIHNSLVAFLKEETRSKLPGADFEKDERDYHWTLADRCGNSSCAEPLGRAKVLHLARAKRDKELLALLSSSWLREAISAFLPYAEIRSLILLGLGAAWKCQEFGEVVRLILLNFELAERIGRIEPEDLAKALLELDQPDVAVSQIRSGGRVLVEDKIALRFAARLWDYGAQHGRRDLQETARTIHLQAKPIGFIFGNEPIDTHRHHDFADTLHAWAAAAPLFEDPPQIIDQIARLQFVKPERPVNAIVPSGVKAGLLYEAFYTALDWNGDAYKPFLDELRNLPEPYWLFHALLLLYRKNPGLLAELEALHGTLEPDPDFDITFATVLVDHGHTDKARPIVSRLAHVRCDTISNEHSLGLNDISYTARLSYLRALLGIQDDQRKVEDERDEAVARIEVTARRLGTLLAQLKSGKPIENLRDTFREILLFHNRPVAFANYDRRNDYLLGVSKTDIYNPLIGLARRIGAAGMESLRDTFLELLDSPAKTQFAPVHRRLFARAFFEAGVLNATETASIGVSLTDTDDNDPIQRERACLDIAVFLHSIGQKESVHKWLAQAGTVSAGAGSHKDYHMAQLSEWLTLSLDKADLDDRNLSSLNRFAQAIEVSGGAGGSRATTNLIKWMAAVDALRSVKFATEVIDRDVLNVSETLDALLIGCAHGGATPSLLGATYCELLSLIHPRSTSSAAVAVLKSFPISERVSAAKRLMTSVRTNSMPTHRVGIARDIQDALRDNKLGEFDFTKGLKPGHDDFSWKSALYKLASGEILTTDQVAERLSNPDQTQNWNPNPADNGEFDWFRAIRRTAMKDLAHLNAVLAAVHLPDYRDSEMLAWKSGEFLRLGDREKAKQMAEEALVRANTGSWFTWLDGAKLRVAYEALKPFDTDVLEKAREHFGRDLAAGKLNSAYLLDDILELFEFLEIKWPSAAALNAIDDYLSVVLTANRPSRDFSSFTEPAEKQGTVDEALCRFLFQLLSFPVINVAVAARVALTIYADSDGTGIVPILRGEISSNVVQLEYLLACVHVGCRNDKSQLRILEREITNLNKHQSIAVRAIARRICEEQGWEWQEIRTMRTDGKVIITPKPTGKTVQEARMVLGRDAEFELSAYSKFFELLEKAGNDRAELDSEFVRIFHDVEKRYLWADEARFKRWLNLVHARFWLSQAATIGREAFMRVVGDCALRGRASTQSEELYDILYPIYDPALEIRPRVERPAELVAMDWDRFGEVNKSWLRGEGADSWNDYPSSVNGLQIIGERTLFISPEWEWPREERYRGLLLGGKSDVDRDSLASRHELTFSTYLQGIGQNEDQIVIWNSERQLVGPAYRWIAFNSLVARRLGWQPSNAEPFQWLNRDGELMVTSLFWRDGWIDLEPPHFEALGEGWLVLATPSGMQAIRDTWPEAEYHLWIERHSHGKAPYTGAWHLKAPLL